MLHLHSSSNGNISRKCHQEARKLCIDLLSAGKRNRLEEIARSYERERERMLEGKNTLCCSLKLRKRHSPRHSWHRKVAFHYIVNLVVQKASALIFSSSRPKNSVYRNK